MTGRYAYSPDAEERLSDHAASAARVLIVGSRDLSMQGSGDVRHAVPPEVGLPNGRYEFRLDGSVDLMVVVGGQRPSVAISIDDPASDPAHMLCAAYQWFGFYWASAEPAGPPARFAVGDTALKAGTSDYVHIKAIERHDGVNRYRVVINGQRQMMTEEGLLPLPHDELDPTSWIEMPPASATELGVSLTVTKLTNPLTDTVYSYLSSKTVFRPYQFRPVLRMIGSAHQRLLIADEVGLGKTIEAGLIWSELEARSQGLQRVLIVCPAVLKQKWCDEMGRRFDRRVTMLDKRTLGEFMAALEEGDDAPLVGVASLEQLRSAKTLADLDELNPRFDLVIVDEAHYLRNRNTRNFDLGEMLSSWADALVFLSATPLNLGTDDLFNLLNLLVPEEFGDKAVFADQLEPNRYLNAAASELLARRDAPGTLLASLAEIEQCELGEQVLRRPEFEQLERILSLGRRLSGSELAEAKRLLLELNTLSSIVSRTRKVDVPDRKAVRQPHSIDVEWTDDEARLYLAVLEWARRRARASGAPPGFATQMPLRQAASCLPAVIDMIRSKDPTAFMPPSAGGAEDDFDDLAFGDDESGEDVDLTDLGALAAAASGVDTKFDRFVQELRNAAAVDSQQVLVFSFFRRTLEYLHDRLTELGFRAKVMHGGVKVADRQTIMNEFRNGDFDILLSSEVGSEGLDFEFCNVVVNYDMPWNPMRVEQRIGRLDRFGQLHDRIFVFNFHVPGTIETDIFERLYHRINVFTTSIGELEPILRDEFTTVTRIALDPKLTSDERERQLQQFEIAIERRARDVTEIEEASAYMSGIDSLLIEGFEDDTKSRGRFVGPEELRHLLKAYFGEVGGARLRTGRRPYRATLIGDTRLGDTVSRCSQARSGTRYRIAELSALLRDEEPIEVTFSNDDASQNGIELISLRHPVVRAAVQHFADLPNGVRRFASVTVPGLTHPHRRYLTILYLAETTGLRPSLELWPMTVCLDGDALDRQPNESEEVGYALLAAVSNGSLEDAAMPEADALLPRLEEITGLAYARQSSVEAERQRANDRLVDSRFAARRAGIEYRIDKARNSLADAQAKMQSQQIRRMHEGRIRNLEHELEQIAVDMESRRQLSLSLSPVAVAVVTGDDSNVVAGR